jgi:hypothetical protein
MLDLVLKARSNAVFKNSVQTPTSSQYTASSSSQKKQLIVDQCRDLCVVRTPQGVQVGVRNSLNLNSPNAASAGQSSSQQTAQTPQQQHQQQVNAAVSAAQSAAQQLHQQATAAAAAQQLHQQATAAAAVQAAMAPNMGATPGSAETAVELYNRSQNDDATSSNGDEDDLQVRTLFVSGLPMDTKPREIYLLFRGFKGYQGSLLKLTGKEGKKATPVAFVTFENREQAEVTKSELQGVRFDPELPTTIRIEFAKANTKVTKPTVVRPPTLGLTPGSPGVPTPTFPAFDLATGIFTTDASQLAQHPHYPIFSDINGNALPQQLHPGLTTAYMSPLDRLHTLGMSLPPNVSNVVGNTGIAGIPEINQ